MGENIRIAKRLLLCLQALHSPAQDIKEKKKNQDTDDIQYFCFSKKQLITEKRVLQ